jgi:NADH-quinone oxidoreductase B subunit
LVASAYGWSHVLEQVKTWARANSPWVVHFNTGSCNGCDIEILATLTPRYDLERFGVKLKGSPRHADVLLATGPVTRQARERLLQVYAQMHDPKFVVAIGSCALSGGAFRGCYSVMNGIDQVIPVSAYIPGCPPRPEAIIDGVVKLVQSLTAPKPAPNASLRGASSVARGDEAISSAQAKDTIADVASAHESPGGDEIASAPFDRLRGPRNDSKSAGPRHGPSAIQPGAPHA